MPTKNLRKTRKNTGLSTKMNYKIKKKKSSDTTRKVIIAGIVVSSAMVILSIVVSVFFNDEAIAHRKFNQLVREYYEDYFYDKMMETIEDDLVEKKLAKFAQSGVQPVTLRQVLLYQNGKNSEYKKYFDTGAFYCDKNNTEAIIYPEEPFGKKDYHIEFKYSCQSE
ncbi:hypothetical protein IKG02_03460 [Candidatus Saccharibacteria bacterium]|nr:hypothetical protein [Candidatus Saccharibacteria bacterium]